MFDILSDKLQQAFKALRGQARLTDANVAEAMSEVRTALLEADVNIDVANEFVETVKADSLGMEVLKSVTPGQQLIKIVNDRLVELMGEADVPLNLPSHPSVIMMVGLHGSGKTTTTAKVALNLKKQKKKVLLAACDIYRPAAVDQLEVLGREIDVPVYAERGCADVAVIAANAVEHAKIEHLDVVILDTAGRLQIDEMMVQELVRAAQSARTDEIILVADAAIGQESVSVADHFHKALGLTGIILTKLDGDARGGAALSIRKVTGCPIKFVGVGEKLDDLEVFYPDRMASRILGMGDIVSLVEKAAEQIDEEEARKLQEKLRKNKFDFNDFLSQLRQMSQLGGMEAILKMLPGGKQMAGMMEQVDPKHLSRLEAIICSMTGAERERPELIDMSRRKRIAAGSGTTLPDVAALLKNFEAMRGMMKKTGLLGRLLSGGGFGGGAVPPGPGGILPGLPGGSTVSARELEKRRKLQKLKKKQKQKQRKNKR